MCPIVRSNDDDDDTMSRAAASMPLFDATVEQKRQRRAEGGGVEDSGVRARKGGATARPGGTTTDLQDPRRPPAAGHAASRRCNPNERSIPLPPPMLRHGQSSPFAIVDARTGGTETAAAQGALALRILAHDKRGEGRAMTMMMTAFEKSPDDNQPRAEGGGGSRVAGQGGSRESGGAPEEGLRSGGAQTTISRGWGSQLPHRRRGSRRQSTRRSSRTMAYDARGRGGRMTTTVIATAMIQGQ